MTHSQQNNAFTIIELLVTVSIIGVLLGLVSIGVARARVHARDTQRIGDVHLLAQALDLSASYNRGTYPVNVFSPGSPTFCVDAIYDPNPAGGHDALNNANKIDLSVFNQSKQKGSANSNRAIPIDPLPLDSSRNCSNILGGAAGGYTYHRRSVAAGGVAINNYALRYLTAYSLEVALENERPIDEVALKKPSELVPADTALDTVSLSGSRRFRYVLNGKYCKDSCY